MNNWPETVIRQYSGAERIMSILDTFNQAVSIDDFTDQFITDVWDVLTAKSYGLDVWGKIVGIGRNIIAPIESDSFGFADGFTPFNDAPFFAGIQETTNVRLGDDAYRTLILCKAFSNISIATIPEFNRFLTMLFKGRGVAFCSNYKEMTMGIICAFELRPYEAAILQNYDVMPVPSGVRIEMHELVPPYFGFAEDAYPFNDGTFYKG